MLVTLLACSNNDQDDTKTLIQNLQMPSSDIPLIEKQLVTIQGMGFIQTSQIWLRNVKTKAEEDIQAEVTKVDDKSLTFKVPENASGKKEIILKQNGNEYLLGTLTFKKKYKYYAFYHDSYKQELAEIDIENGNIIWNDLKIPGFGLDSRGYVFNESGNELVALGHVEKEDVPTIFSLNMITKEVKTIKLKDGGEYATNFKDIVAYKQ